MVLEVRGGNKTEMSKTKMDKYIFKCIDTSTMYEFCFSCYAKDRNEAIEKFEKNNRGSVVYTHIAVVM